MNDPFTRLVVEGHPRAVAAEAALQWMDTTHGNEFGHDHHCPLASIDYRQAWTYKYTTEEAERCTCGWAAFRLAYDREVEARP